MDGHVQVAADGAGKKIDNTELQRAPVDPAWDATAGATVYRQRIVLASDESPNVQVHVRGEPGRGALTVSAQTIEEMASAINEIRDMLRLLLS
mgnify:CR=1 FL=1